jgi:hypothetical protein
MTLFRTVDTKIYDAKRLFRLPNSIHSATGLYKVQVDIEFVRNSTWEDMKLYASEPHELNNVQPKFCAEAAVRFNTMIKKCHETAENQFKAGVRAFKKGMTPPCIEEMLKSGAQEGNRNNTTVILASTLLQSGKTLDETLTIMKDWNEEKNCPKLSEREVVNTVKSAYKELVGGKKFGCRSVKEAGFCEGIKCPMKGNM